MIRLLPTMLLLLSTFASSGCILDGLKERFAPTPRVRNPPLSASMTTRELVDFINRQNKDLNGWRSTSTRMDVRLPNMIPQRLSGAIACQTPSYFRLTADNLVAKTDLGSNNHRCWAYVQPGESAVMTWKHEDTPLLQQVSIGVPYIDPNWLMLVLGITPLDAADYQIRPGDDRHLLLESIVTAPSGRPLRRVIKFDRYNRVVREHLIADSEANTLVQAILSDHDWHEGQLIPGCVRLDFPQMKTEIRLTFRDIETNPSLPDSLWYLPDSDVQVVDVGEIIRHKMAAENPHLAEQLLSPRQPASPFAEVTGNGTAQFAEAAPNQYGAPHSPTDHGSAAQYADGRQPSIRLQQPSFHPSAPTAPHGEALPPNPFADYEASAIPQPEWSDATSDAATGSAQTLPIDHGFLGTTDEAIPEPEWSTSSISHTRPVDPPPRKRSLMDRMFGR